MPGNTLVSFNYGTKSNLPSTKTDGGLYITTDSGELYLHKSNSTTKISDFETVATENDLPTVGTQISNKFYYVTATNGLYRVVNNAWEKIGGDPVSAGSGLSYALDGITLNHSNSVTAGSTSSSSGQLVNGGTLNLPKVNYDAQGHITSVETTSCTLPSVAEGTVTGVTAGAGLAGGTISTSGTIKASLKDETKLGASNAAASTATSGKFYPVQLDSSGYLAVDVPWENTSAVTSVNTQTGAVVLSASDVGAIASTLKGAVNGVAELDSSGKVPSAQLPSYVDDVIEAASTSAFPATGESGKIYVALDTNKTYRWGGTEYVEISESLALGTTSSTAYRGDYGNTAYEHSQNTGATTTYASGLYKVTVNSMGHVTDATAVAKSDITALGIPAQDTTYSVQTEASGGTTESLVTTGDIYNWNRKTSNAGTVTDVTAGAGLAGGTISSSGTIKASLKSETKLGASNAAASTATSGKFYPVQLDSSDYLAVDVPWTDTTYESKTAAQGGTDESLVTTGEKYTWNNKTDNTGTVTGVTAGAGLAGGTISTSGTLKASLKSETKLGASNAAAATETTGKFYPVQLDTSGYLAVDVPWTDTTYSVGTPVSAGTDVSLVTTGDMYNWNNKTSNTGTVESITAGNGLSGGTITTSGTISLPSVGTGAGTSGSTSAQTPTWGSTFDVPYVTTDAYGRVSARGTATVTIPNTTATQQTAGLLSAADKAVIDDISVLSGMTNDPASTSQALASTAWLCNYLSAQKMVITLATTDWSGSTTTVDGNAYYYIYIQVSNILVNHPIMFLATDSIPTSDQESAWGELKMVADTTNNYLRFYSAAVPTVNIPVGINGVVPLPSA